MAKGLESYVHFGRGVAHYRVLFQRTLYIFCVQHVHTPEDGGLFPNYFTTIEKRLLDNDLGTQNVN